MLEYGDDIEQDLLETLSWHEKAATLGNQKAIEKAEKVQHKLNEVKPTSIIQGERPHEFDTKFF